MEKKLVVQQFIQKFKKLYGPYKKLFWIGGGLLAVLVLFLIFSFKPNHNDAAAQVQYAMVTRGDLTESIDVVGALKAQPMVELSWESAGIVSLFDVKTGDKVTEGLVLISLEDSSLASSLLQAQSDLLEAQAELDKMLAANTDLISALEDVRYQERLLTNKYSMRHEFYGNDVSDARIEAFYANYNQAREEVRALEEACEKVKELEKDDPERVQANEALQVGILRRDSLLRALSQIMGTPYGQRAEGYFIAYDQQKQVAAEARASYARLLDSSEEIAAARAMVQALQNTIDQASIIAPFTGTITAIQSVGGNYVKSGDIAVQLDDLSNLAVDLDISQMDINKVYAGQSANLTLTAVTNSIYSGTVTEISKAGKVNDDGEITFQVTVAIAHPDSQIKTGFNATASIIINQVEDALLVPNTAIQYDNAGNAFVYSVNNLGISSQISIDTGARSDAYSELVTGELDEGDHLAVAQIDNESLEFGQSRGMGLPFLNFLR